MKKLLILTTLIFSLMFPSTSFAEWKKVSEGVKGDTFYVDFERIKKHGGYVYWWELGDYLKPNERGILSGKVYKQGDCKLIRVKYFSGSFHKEPMGGGTGKTVTLKNPEWKYPPPESIMESILKTVCEYAK